MVTTLFALAVLLPLGAALPALAGQVRELVPSRARPACHPWNRHEWNPDRMPDHRVDEAIRRNVLWMPLTAGGEQS